jgi:hypothetical protein
LVRAALGFRVFVTGQGAGRFLHLALGPVHGAFVFVLPAARASSTHLLLLVPGMFAIYLPGGAGIKRLLAPLLPETKDERW